MSDDWACMKCFYNECSDPEVPDNEHCICCITHGAFDGEIEEGTD